MRKYVEFGIGNRWLLRTELEHEDGTETEVKGFQRPFRCHSVYMRLWIGHRVLILDSREGLKLTRKPSRKFKWIIGLSGE
ncbi:DUF3977 family protein [Gorillibacterium timonense]|uniref:DUF3977 family protein n=1 Tax=Gorillibacterium timonense TaxID=1689269 RepID=UPI00071CE925|nr:DUF3977 family protein [Gorillibacterium timonense]